MRILATKAEFESLPDWVREFADAAWAREDLRHGFSTVHRLPVLHFKNMREIAGRFAECLQEAIRNPDACEHNVSLLLTDSPRLVRATVFVDRDIRIAHALMEAWNSRAAITECTVCRSLIQPSKGKEKVTQTCSGACRVKLHRQQEEYRQEERAFDAAHELEQERQEEMESYNYGEDED